MAPLTESFEGYRPAPYWDPANIRTYCYGETQFVEERIYSKEECAAKLRARMAKDYGPYITDCMPALVDPKYRRVLGAAIDTSYNTGPAPVCKRMGPLVAAGRFKDACNSIRGWYVTAKNRRTGVRKTLPGLVRRRNEIADFCVAGLA